MRKTTVAVVTMGLAAALSMAVHAGERSAPRDGVDPRRLQRARSSEDQLLASEATQRASTAAPSVVANMTFHGGRVLLSPVTKAVFWGTSWSKSAFVGDKITGLDAFYTGFSGSNYAKTATEYSGINGQINATTRYQGHILDTSAVTSGDDPNKLLAQLCKLVSSGKIVPDAAGAGYYPIYTDLKRGSANYCAWHAAGTCSGVPVQFAFFFNLDGDPNCDPRDTQTGHSQGLAALANVSAHEFSEARTDPSVPGAWYDANGDENGDKCAWTFHVPYVTLKNGGKWKLQGEWSNNAYNAGTGYATASGVRGCITGQ
jgi:hypothetical protein